MMDGKVISETQNQGQQIDHSGRFDSKGSNFLPTLGICYLTLNTVIAIFRAHAHNDTPMIFFIVFLYVGFLSLYTCFMAFDRLPRNEESCRKDCLKAVIWIISTALNFGLAIRFSQLLFPIASVFIFAMAITSSAFGFYFFFIYRDADVSSNCCSDKKIKSFQPSYPSPMEKVSDNKLNSLESSTSPFDII